jgi:hypothetical protein
MRAYRQRAVARIDDAPKAPPLSLSLAAQSPGSPPGSGNLHTSTSEAGAVSLLGHTFESIHCGLIVWFAVRIDLSNQTLRFHALRRRDPNHQPLLCRTPYAFPRTLPRVTESFMALPYESCFLRPRGYGTWPITCSRPTTNPPIKTLADFVAYCNNPLPRGH